MGGNYGFKNCYFLSSGYREPTWPNVKVVFCILLCLKDEGT
jgi:hypothetical protein